MATATIHWLERFFTSAFTLENDKAELSVTETETVGDDGVLIVGKYGSYPTPDATVVEIPLPWSAADGDVWAIDALVTAKGASVQRRIKLSAVIYGAAGVATIDGTVDVDAKGTGTPTATITVDGATEAMRLELTPGAAAAFTWGFEVRGQKL